MDSNDVSSNLDFVSNPYSLINSPKKKTISDTSILNNNIKKKCTFSGPAELDAPQENLNFNQKEKEKLEAPMPQTKNQNPNNITKLKQADLFKNMYSVDAGKTIKNIRINMRELKSTYFKNILENVKSEDNIEEGNVNKDNHTYNSYSNRVIKNRNYLNHLSRSQSKSKNNNFNTGNNLITSISNSNSRKNLKKNGSLPENIGGSVMINSNSSSNLNTFREFSHNNNLSHNNSIYFPNITGVNKNINNFTGNNSNTLLFNSINSSGNMGGNSSNNLLLSNSNSQANITLLNLNHNQNKNIENLNSGIQIKSDTGGGSSNFLNNQTSNNQSMQNKPQNISIPIHIPHSESVLKNSVTYNQFYCPCCTHCNNINDDYLEKHIFVIREARNILYKAAEFTIKHNIMKKTNLDLFNSSYVNQMSFSNYINEKGKRDGSVIQNQTQNEFQSQNHNNTQIQISKLNLNLQSNSNINLNNTTSSQVFEKTGKINSHNHTSTFSQPNIQMSLSQPILQHSQPTFSHSPPIPENDADHPSDFESFANNFHVIKNQISSSRQTYQIVYNFMNSLLSDKVNISYFVPHDLVQKLENILLMKGLAFDQNNENIFYDPELESMFDPITKDMIKNLFKKKYLQNLINMKKEDEKKSIEHRKRFTILFIIFLQILSEISVECKERAALLYKFFKMYFCEQEIKWVIVVNKMKEKVRYYKDLCKTIVDQKSKHLDKINKINDILFAQKLTKENLEDHKKLIRDLLKVNNEKKEEIYVLKANNEILAEEMKMWVYDYENVKLNKTIRDELKNLQIENIIKNVNEELKHKK